MPRLHLLRVFCRDDGALGNPLAVLLDGSEVPPPLRPAMAAELGLSETVFVDDARSGEVRIFSPATELDFAGHPLVGAAWLLGERHGPRDALRPPAGAVPARVEGDRAFVAAPPDWGPPFEWTRLPSPSEVDALAGPPGDGGLAGAWSWIDERAGTVRARVFPRRLGVAEDEATGSAATRLCALLGRSIDITQGRGSRIAATPRADGLVEVGGRVALDGVRDHPVPGG